MLFNGSRIGCRHAYAAEKPERHRSCNALYRSILLCIGPCIDISLYMSVEKLELLNLCNGLHHYALLDLGICKGIHPEKRYNSGIHRVPVKSSWACLGPNKG